MSEGLQLNLGLAAGISSTWWWTLFPNWQIYAQQAERSPLAFIEHYHYGLALLLAAPHSKKYSTFLNALGAGLIMSELFQDHPFGAGRAPEEVEANLGLTSVLGGALLASKSGALAGQ